MSLFATVIIAYAGVFFPCLSILNLSFYFLLQVKSRLETYKQNFEAVIPTYTDFLNQVVLYSSHYQSNINC
jgi:hypothetical protein